MKVIVSDSNLITSSKVSTLIKSAGWEVLSASRWHKVKELLESNPDIEVLVLNLEGFGADDIMRNVKKEFPHLKVIAYCGHKNIRLQEEAKNLGADLVVPNSMIVSSVVELIKGLS